MVYQYMYRRPYIRPTVVNSLFPVTLLHCSFRAACVFIIIFGNHVTKILLHPPYMLLSVCVVVSLGDFEDICVHCGQEDQLQVDNNYRIAPNFRGLKFS